MSESMTDRSRQLLQFYLRLESDWFKAIELMGPPLAYERWPYETPITSHGTQIQDGYSANNEDS